MIVTSFQPWHALLGGVSLGILSAGKTLITSRVLGISGTVKGWLQGNFAPRRALFVGGLLSAGLVARRFLPAAFDVLPGSFTMTRAIAAGLLVGCGSVLGNGCTSGHGIAGNSRLSKRSFVYTVTFFVSGMIVCAATATTAALGVVTSAPAYAPLQGVALKQAIALVATAAAGTAAAGVVASRTKNKNVGVAYDGFAGLFFGLGLCFSGMTRPSLVAAALAAFTPAWNFSLMFVMGGGIAAALPLFQLVILKRKTALDGTDLSLSGTSQIDWKLLLGGVLFGAGWGVGGMCPGPAIVALAHPQPQLVVMVAAMLVGMAAGLRIARTDQCDAPRAAKKAQA